MAGGAFPLELLPPSAPSLVMTGLFVAGLVVGWYWRGHHQRSVDKETMKEIEKLLKRRGLLKWRPP